MIDKNELLFVVDENNNPIEPKPRQEVHEKGYWHRVSDVWIKNSNNQILCQKRSLLKDSNPGRWERFFGGHLLAGEDYLESTVKELKEEIGLDIKKEALLLFKMVKYDKAKDFRAVYLLKWDGDINNLSLERDEIDELRWIDIEEAEKNLLDRNPGWTNVVYEEEMIDWLKNK